MASIQSVQRVDVDQLIPYINNAKQHPEEQVLKIASSIREFGFVNPVLIDKDFNVIAGHGRILAAKKLGLMEVPCVFVEGLTDAQRKAYILADNRLGELGDWDMDLVTSELEMLIDNDFDIDLTGFVLLEEQEETEIIEDEPPEEVETRCKLGDLWQVGGIVLFVEILRMLRLLIGLWMGQRLIWCFAMLHMGTSTKATIKTNMKCCRMMIRF